MERRTHKHTHHHHQRHTVILNTPIDIKYVYFEKSLYDRYPEKSLCVYNINREMMVICCLYQFHKRKYFSNVVLILIHRFSFHFHNKSRNLQQNIPFHSLHYGFAIWDTQHLHTIFSSIHFYVEKKVYQCPGTFSKNRYYMNQIHSYLLNFSYIHTTKNRKLWRLNTACERVSEWHPSTKERG